MSFNQFSNRSINFGRTKSSKRNEIIAKSRAQRQERQKKKKNENAAQIIQKWIRMKSSYNQTIQQCKKQFNQQIKSILQSQQQQQSPESSLNFDNFNNLLHLFRICIFGFKNNPKKWKLPKQYTSKLKKYENDQKWFTMSIKRLYSIFLRIIKTSQKEQHFISKVIDNKTTKSQMIRFQFFSIILIQYLSLMFSPYLSSFFFVWHLLLILTMYHVQK